MGYPVQWNKIPNWGCLPPRKKSLKATAINNTHNCNQTQIDQGKSSPFFIIIILFSCFSKFLLWHPMSFLHFTSQVFFRSIPWTLLLLQLHRFIKMTILLMLNVADSSSSCCQYIVIARYQNQVKLIPLPLALHYWNFLKRFKK